MNPYKISRLIFYFYCICAVVASWLAMDIAVMRSMAKNKTIAIQQGQIDSLELRCMYLRSKLGVK